MGDEKRLVVRLLPGDGVLLEERLKTDQIHPRLIEQPLIINQLSLELSLRQLKWPRVDLGEKVTFFDELAFRKADLQELAVDLRSHGHIGNWRDRAKAGHHDLDVAGSNSRHTNRGRSGVLLFRGKVLLEP